MVGTPFFEAGGRRLPGAGSALSLTGKGEMYGIHFLRFFGDVCVGHCRGLEGAAAFWPQYCESLVSYFAKENDWAKFLASNAPDSCYGLNWAANMHCHVFGCGEKAVAR